jgi:hypothetical protein
MGFLMSSMTAFSVTFFALLIGVILLVTPIRSDHRAEQIVCHRLAAEVQDEKASPFAYMATRCPARLIVGQEGK